MNKLLNNIEKNKTLRLVEVCSIILLLVLSFYLLISSEIRINKKYEKVEFQGEITLQRDKSIEDYDEDNLVCDVYYINGNDKLVISYSYDEYLKLDKDTIKGYKYLVDEKEYLVFEHSDLTSEEINTAYRNKLISNEKNNFNLAISSLILAISIGVILIFSHSFTNYEKIWFISVIILAFILSIVFPEDTINGVNGVLIMALYLFDTLFNVICELLISKQSRYNFLVSILVEIVEILICIVLMYRFATLVTTLFFWLPIDIISFINWSSHKDETKEELTIVRKLKGYQEALVIIGIIVWTIVVGYIISGLNINSDLFNKDLGKIIAYIDACASAVGVANGLFIFFRLQEQWIAWYICAFLESVINILTGQYVLLALKIGYFTNTTYGFIKWNRYINTHNNDDNSIF